MTLTGTIIKDGANIPCQLADSGETVYVNRRHLEHVETEVYRALLRPRIYRELCPVGAFGIPEWVQTTTYDKIVSQAEWRPVSWAGHSGDMATASVQVAPGEVKSLFWMRSGFSYEDRELIRAQNSGVALDTERGMAVVDKAQSELEQIAFKGTTTLADHPIASATTGVYGVANLSGVDVETSLSASGSTSWTDLIDAAITSGTVDDYIQVVNTILADITQLETKIETDTKQNVRPDTLLMPLSLSGPLATLLHPHTGRSAQSHILEASRFIKQWKFWHLLETAGGSSKRRLIAYPASNERVLRLVIVKEPQQLAPLKRAYDTYVPFEMGVMGADSKLPEGMVYYDMPANA